MYLGNGVDVYQTEQQPGTFVVTFPQAYHCGFSYGVSQCVRQSYSIFTCYSIVSLYTTYVCASYHNVYYYIIHLLHVHVYTYYLYVYVLYSSIVARLLISRLWTGWSRVPRPRRSTGHSLEDPCSGILSITFYMYST